VQEGKKRRAAVAEAEKAKEQAAKQGDDDGGANGNADMLDQGKDEDVIFVRPSCKLA
jgi:hypothetical protein